MTIQMCRARCLIRQPGQETGSQLNHNSANFQIVYEKMLCVACQGLSLLLLSHTPGVSYKVLNDPFEGFFLFNEPIPSFQPILEYLARSRRQIVQLLRMDL